MTDMNVKEKAASEAAKQISTAEILTIMTAPVPRSTIEDAMKISGTVFNNLEDKTARRE